MIFTPTKIPGAWIIDPERVEDNRGFFARSWCKKEFEAHGIHALPVQINTSYSKQRGTIRGIHYQLEPFAETKLMRCIQGAIYDVILDLRPGSPTYRQWIAVELSASSQRMVFVPEGCAHGFQSLEDHSVALYQVSQFYSPLHERGIRYNDPAFSIEWPLEVSVISEKDCRWDDFCT